MKIKQTAISALLLASFVASSSCNADFFKKKSKVSESTAKQMVYAPELDPGVHELTTDHRFKSLESDEPVRFETAVTPEEAANDVPVELHDSNGNTLSKMYDDGTHSDRIAGDGIYTCNYQPKPNDETSYSYTANIGGEETKPAEVRYFDKITDQDIEDMKEVHSNFAKVLAEQSAISADMTSEEREKVLDSLGEYAKELYNIGQAVEYRVNKEYDNMVIKLSSGITCIYSNPSTGYWGGGTTQPTTITAPSYAVEDLTIKGFMPLLQQELNNLKNNNGLDFTTSLQDSTINTIVNTADFHGNITDGGTTYSTSVTPQSINNWGQDQIIFWIGHGGYDGVIHSYLATNEVFDSSKYTAEDFIEDRILVKFQADIMTGFNTEEEYDNGSIIPIDANGDGTIDQTDVNIIILAYDKDGNNTLDKDEYYDYLSDLFDITTCITSEYIDAHCPDLTGSFIYLSSCHALQDSVLASSLLHKNCNVVVGYSNAVNCGYETDYREELIKRMCTPKTTTHGTPYDYPSIGEVYSDLSRTSLGKNVTSNAVAAAVFNYTQGFTTKPVILGNRTYSFATAIADTLAPPINPNELQGRGQLYTDKAYYSIAVGDTIDITITSRPMGAGTLKWSIDDSSIASITDYDEINSKLIGQTPTDPPGKLTGKKPGTTRGYVYTADGKYRYSFTVKVT